MECRTPENHATSVDEESFWTYFSMDYLYKFSETRVTLLETKASLLLQLVVFVGREREGQSAKSHVLDTSYDLLGISFTLVPQDFIVKVVDGLQHNSVPLWITFENFVVNFGHLAGTSGTLFAPV